MQTTLSSMMRNTQDFLRATIHHDHLSIEHILTQVQNFIECSTVEVLIIEGVPQSIIFYTVKTRSPYLFFPLYLMLK